MSLDPTGQGRRRWTMRRVAPFSCQGLNRRDLTICVLSPRLFLVDHLVNDAQVGQRETYLYSVCDVLKRLPRCPGSGTVALADAVDLTLGGGSALDLFGTLHLSGGTLNLPGHQHNWHEGAALLGAGEVALTGNAGLNGTGHLTVEPGVGIVLNTAA